MSEREIIEKNGLKRNEGKDELDVDVDVDVDVVESTTDTMDKKEKPYEYDPTYEIQSWDDLEIPIDLLRGIYAYGFEKPSPIQKKAIKPIMMGKDLIAQAQSGTGKTATFTIGALANIKVTDQYTQVLILSPTRELSKQTALVASSIGNMMEGLKVQLLVGGNPIEEDIRKLSKETPHLIVGCPGRVYDMMCRSDVKGRSVIACQKIKLVILDEADEMFSNGFKEQVYQIFQKFNGNIQVGLFSATLPPSINEIIHKLLREPVRVEVKAEQLTLEGISQFYVSVDDDIQKYQVLKELYESISMSQCIIYCNSLKRVQELYEAMVVDGYPVCRMHSGMDTSERVMAFSEFRSGKYRVLISSNVTARGIDIQQVSVVINFDLSKDIDIYLHRIGRSGRWGRKGMAINLITRRDVQLLKSIREHYACQIDELPANYDTLLA